MRHFWQTQLENELRVKRTAFDLFLFGVVEKLFATTHFYMLHYFNTTFLDLLTLVKHAKLIKKVPCHAEKM